MIICASHILLVEFNYKMLYTCLECKCLILCKYGNGREIVMKKRFMKQFALLLAAVIAFESAYTTDVAATTQTVTNIDVDYVEEQQEDGETVSANEIESDLDLSEEVSEETDGQQIEEKETAEEESSKNDDDEKASRSVSDSNIEETASEGLLDFLYVEHDTIAAPQTQSFLLGIASGEETVENATLEITNIATGEVKELASEDVTDGVAYFAEEFTDTAEHSIYQVTAASWQIGGSTTRVLLEDTGIVAAFGVNEQVTYADEEPEITAADVEANIVTTDGMEITTTADRIAEALSEADATSLQSKVLNSEGLSINPSTKELTANRASSNVTIVLDPGHDATHAGASGNGLKEEELNLKIATYCKEELETYDGVKVYMTRSGTACPYPGTTSTDDNAKRVQFAKSVGATAFVSIHINSSTVSGSNGAAVYYPNSNYNATIGSTGKNLATKIQEKLVALGIKNNGIQIRNSQDGTKYPDGSLADYYGVIRQSKLAGFPGIIIEHAFISNASDAASFLGSDDKLKKLGVADATGIAEYFGLSKSSDTGSITVSDENYAKGTFKVNVKNVEEGKTVQIKVYPKTNQTKDASYSTTYKKGVYSATVDIKYHGYIPDTYVIVAYTVEANGSLKRLGKKEYAFNEPKYGTVKLTAEPTSATKKSYKIQATVKAAAKLEVQVYNTASKSETLQKIDLTVDKNGVWSTTLSVSKLKKLGGTYKVIAYATSCFGTKTKIATTSFVVPAPKMGKIKLAEQDNKKGTFTLEIPNVTSDSGIKSVQVEVWSLSDKKDLKVYTAKKSADGTYIVKGNIKYHDYNYGTYKTRVTVVGKNGITTISKARSVKIKKPVAVVTAKTSASQTTTKITAENVLLSGNVTDVKVVVCSKAGKKKDQVTYIAKKLSKSKWTATIKNADIAKAGTYYVTVYAKSDRSKSFSKVGTTTYEIEGPSIESTYVSEKLPAKGTFAVTASGIKCKGGISKVEVLVFKAPAKSKGVVYKAKKKGSKYYAKVDIADLGGKKGTYKVVVTAYSKSGIAYSAKTINVKMNADVDTNLYSIMGTTGVSVEQMVAYYNANATYPSYYAGTDAPTIKKFCELYLSECGVEGVKAEVAFVQAMKETNFLRYGGDVKISQFNFAGLGATGGGVSGASFSSVKIGIRAQVQHLKAYASTDALSQGCVDGRFAYVTRGCAPYVEWLGINENPSGKGWATDPGYGNDIVQRIKVLMTY